MTNSSFFVTSLYLFLMVNSTKKLEAAGYIEVKKEFIKRKPHTMFILTKKGRDAFEAYTKRMKHLFEGF